MSAISPASQIHHSILGASTTSAIIDAVIAAAPPRLVGVTTGRGELL
jgi:hypothetical protein